MVLIKARVDVAAYWGTMSSKTERWSGGEVAVFDFLKKMTEK